jgi:hypothetical protein
VFEKTMRGSWLISFACLACSAANLSETRYPASQVAEVASAPAGYAVGQRLRATCRVVTALESTSLADVDCSFERLSRVLRARAGEASSPFLIEKECQLGSFGASELECSAALATPTGRSTLTVRERRENERPAPSPAEVLDLDEPRPQDAEQLQVSFVPAAAKTDQQLPARSYDRVAETAFAPLGRRELGQITARCGGCSAEALRYALRVTAGHVGAGEISGVKCFDEAGDLRCVGTAFAPWSS